MKRGQEFLCEIHGTEGDIALAARMRASTQRQELTVRGARGADKDLAELAVPARYRWVPDAVPQGSPYNVAQLYAVLGRGIRGEASAYPDFGAAVARHRMLDMITEAARTGQKQVPPT